MVIKITYFVKLILQKDVSVLFKWFLEIKNKLIALSYDDEEDNDFQPETIDCVELYDDIINFNKNYKRKPKKFRRIPTKSYDLK